MKYFFAGLLPRESEMINLFVVSSTHQRGHIQHIWYDKAVGKIYNVLGNRYYFSL